jgi:hypothetical protein
VQQQIIDIGKVARQLRSNVSKYIKLDLNSCRRIVRATVIDGISFGLHNTICLGTIDSAFTTTEDILMYTRLKAESCIIKNVYSYVGEVPIPPDFTDKLLEAYFTQPIHAVYNLLANANITNSRVVIDTIDKLTAKVHGDTLTIDGVELHHDGIANYICDMDELIEFKEKVIQHCGGVYELWSCEDISHDSVILTHNGDWRALSLGSEKESENGGAYIIY